MNENVRTAAPERIITPVGRDLDLLLSLVQRLGERRSNLVSAAIIQRVHRVGWVKARVLLAHLYGRNMVGPPNHLDQHQLQFDKTETHGARTATPP